MGRSYKKYQSKNIVKVVLKLISSLLSPLLIQLFSMLQTYNVDFEKFVKGKLEVARMP